MNEVDLGWMAGILDGEGSVVLVRNSYVRKSDGRRSISPRVLMAVTDFSIVKKYTTILSNLGVDYTYVLQRYDRPNGDKYLPKINVNVHKLESVVLLLENVTPLLTLKRKAAELVLEYARWRLEFGYLLAYNKEGSISRKHQDIEQTYWKRYREVFVGKAKSHKRDLSEAVMTNSVPLHWPD